MQLQVVLISSVVSIIVVMLKDAFDTRARRAEWQYNRDAWLLEKEAKDVEEIIVALNEFVVQKGDLVRSITNELLNASMTLGRDLTVEQAAEIDREVNSAIEDSYEKFADFHGEVSKWFYYRPQTLTVWLRDAATVEAELKALERNLLTLPKAGMFGSTLPWREATLERYRAIVETNITHAESMEMETDAALKQIAEFQRGLTRRLRDTSKVD